MKVKELIEKLQALDPEMTVTHSDSEYGPVSIEEVWVNEDAWVYWDKATVVQLSGTDLTKEDIDPKYFRPQERPVHKPSPMSAVLANAYRDAFESQLSRDAVMLSRLSHPSVNKDGFVEFKIVKGDGNGKD